MPIPIYVQKIIERNRARKLAREKALGVKYREYFQPRARWATEEEVCEYLRITPEQLEHDKAYSGLPYLKIRLTGKNGKPYFRVRYELNDLEVWLQKRAYTNREPRTQEELEAFLNREEDLKGEE